MKIGIKYKGFLNFKKKNIKIVKNLEDDIIALAYDNKLLIVELNGTNNTLYKLNTIHEVKSLIYFKKE